MSKKNFECILKTNLSQADSDLIRRLSPKVWEAIQILKTIEPDNCKNGLKQYRADLVLTTWKFLAVFSLLLCFWAGFPQIHNAPGVAVLVLLFLVIGGLVRRGIDSALSRLIANMKSQQVFPLKQEND